MKAIRRCAIYTRTSTEEGLGQEFNSLHAQAEACGAYIRSQTHEGWKTVAKIYEDGGYSGGRLERPALQALLADIAAGKIDIIVVYKVDRLTRALGDFAKIVDILDKAGASFVSVTQSFNTTSSMGRLTLNVLLSFAQFEREVTGERIRDKFAASKAKGIFMGGTPALGYDIARRALHVNEGEAEIVRHIFSRFLALGTIRALAKDLAASGIKSKAYVSRKGFARGGVTFSDGSIAQLLDNPLYRGMIRHRNVVHQGQHAAIIDEETWKRTRLLRGVMKPRNRGTHINAIFRGMIFDDHGNPMRPSTSAKKGVRYTYYVTLSEAKGRTSSKGTLSRAPAAGLDAFVIESVGPLLQTTWLHDTAMPMRVAAALTRLEVRAKEVVITLRADALHEIALAGAERTDDNMVSQTLPVVFARPRNSTIVIKAGRPSVAHRVDRSLVRAITLARAWVARLERGSPASIKALAIEEKLCVLHTAKLLPLAFLAPDLAEQILEGRQPRTLTLTALISEPLPMVWEEQRKRFAAFA